MASTVEQSIRALAERRRLPAPHLERWLAMEPESRGAFLEVAQKLNLRTGQIAAALDLLDETGVREQTTPAAVLSRESVRRAISARGSTPARAAAFLDALRAIRFPRLRRASDRIADAIAALRLPAGISIILPKDLHSDELMVRLSARTGSELRRLVELLAEKQADLARIADMLGEEDEV
jgi:hypothetical protein